jgi:hypothetical protein
MVARSSLAERSVGRWASWIKEQPNTKQRVFWMEMGHSIGQEVRAEVAALSYLLQWNHAVTV